VFVRAGLAALAAMAIVPGAAMAVPVAAGTPVNQTPPTIVSAQSHDPLPSIAVGQSLQCTQGPEGPAGPQGPAGRDAKVTCTVKAAKGKKPPKVTCTVKLVSSSGKVRARLVRGKRVYASGASSAGGVLRLTPRRRLTPGIYKLVLIDRHGVRTVAARVIVR
jgi:hypothetical protein